MSDRPTLSPTSDIDSNTSIDGDRKPYIARPETEQFLEKLVGAIATKEPTGPRLFHVWGVGGVGKTTVLNKLAEPLAGYALPTSPETLISAVCGIGLSVGGVFRESAARVFAAGVGVGGSAGCG